MSDTDEQHLSQSQRTSESNLQVNIISKSPGKRYYTTLEVPMFLSILTSSLTSVAISNVVMYRTCVHALHHDEVICRAFLAPDKSYVPGPLETEVQKYLTVVSTVNSILGTIVPAILLFFLGSWSNTNGRKPLLVWSLFGLSLSQMMVVVYSMLDNFGPWWLILTSIPTALTGGLMVFFTGVMYYVTDVSAPADRSISMVIIQAIMSFGSVIGGLVSSYLLKLVGNVYLLLIAAAFNVVAYAYTNVFVKESLPGGTGAIQGGILSVMDFSLVKEMFRECFKHRPNKGRAQILLLTFTNVLSVFIVCGLISLDYMYTREKLQWSMKEYTIYSAVGTMISYVGSFVGVGLVQKLLPISDLAFTTIAFLSAIAECFVKAFATVGWHMYLGSCIAVFKGLSSPLIASFLSKILPLEDIAKVFALGGALQGIAPLISIVVYNSLYNITLQTFPGAIYILSGGITFVCMVMVVIVQYYRWRMPTSPSYRQMED